jgi:hypothetical protein
MVRSQASPPNRSVGLNACRQRHDPVATPRRMGAQVSARGTRALPGPGRRPCKSQKRLAETARRNDRACQGRTARGRGFRRTNVQSAKKSSAPLVVVNLRLRREDHW